MSKTKRNNTLLFVALIGLLGLIGYNLSLSSISLEYHSIKNAVLLFMLVLFGGIAIIEKRNKNKKIKQLKQLSVSFDFDTISIEQLKNIGSNPMLNGGSPTHIQWIEGNNKGLFVKEARLLKSAALFFLVPGLLMVILDLIYLSSFTVSPPLTTYSDILKQPEFTFSIVGIVFLFFLTPNGLFHASRKIYAGEGITPFEDIIAIQVLTKDVRYKEVHTETFQCFEINLILKDGSRKHVLHNGIWNSILSDVKHLKELLNVPVWKS